MLTENINSELTALDVSIADQVLYFLVSLRNLTLLSCRSMLAFLEESPQSIATTTTCQKEFQAGSSFHSKYRSREYIIIKFRLINR